MRPLSIIYCRLLIFKSDTKRIMAAMAVISQPTTNTISPINWSSIKLDEKPIKAPRYPARRVNQSLRESFFMFNSLTAFLNIHQLFECLLWVAESGRSPNGVRVVPGQKEL